MTGALSVDKLASDDWRLTNPRFTDEAIENNTRLSTFVVETARQKGCTPAQLLLAWVLAKRPYIVPIPGTKRISYLEDNVGAADISLTEKEIETLESVIPLGAATGNRYSADGMSVLAG